MTLYSLTSLVTPPDKPSNAYGDWKGVEQRCGVALPPDYKEFIQVYGTGCIDDFLWVLNPFAQNPNLNLLERGGEALAALRELKHKHDDEVKYPLFPSPGGILPCGVTDNGDVLYWLTKGRPEDWIIVLNAARDSRTEQFESGLGAFLEGILLGRIRSHILPPDFPGPAHSFQLSR